MEQKYFRLERIVGRPAVSEEQAKANQARGKGIRTARPGIKGLLPISRSAWLLGVKQGRYPQPIKLSERTVVWSLAEIEAMVAARAGR
jgi:predicted DNA-binding transcriptional regulator AlpA